MREFYAYSDKHNAWKLKLSSDPRALAFFFPSLQSYSLLLRSYPVKPQGTGTGTHKLYCRAPHLQSKLTKQYLKDL